METRKNTFKIWSSLSVISSLVFTIVVLIFSIINLYLRYKIDTHYSEKVIANQISEGTLFEDKIGLFDLGYTEPTHYYNFEYIYNDNTYEFKVYEKDIPLIMRYVPQTREKAVILLNPNNPAEKIFAQSNGKLKFFIFSLSAIGLFCVLILIRRR